MAGVTLEGVRKVYELAGLVHVAVETIDLTVADGEFLVLVGPSGCGKSTTLRMIAGLEHPTSGIVRIGGRVVNDLPASDRDIAMVFQNYALYPHMTVYQNLAFALTLRRIPRAEIATRVHEAAKLLGLEALLDRKPRHLSGGQRQRVAVGRAIVRQPQVFLFDEPLSNLDAKLRVQMRRELAALRRRLRTTTIYVTHDQVEAMTLGDRIVVMYGGRVQQVDTPLALYQRPANVFVATFVGSPPMNLIRGRVTADAFVAEAGDFRLHTGPPGGGKPGAKVILGIRPEAIRLVAGETQGGGPAATIEEIEPLGNETIVSLISGGVALTARVDGTIPVQRGAVVGLEVSPGGGSLHWFDADSEKRIGTAP